jgi:hypothetical protein
MAHDNDLAVSNASENEAGAPVDEIEAVPRPGRDAALWRLARRLYDEMERLDPTGCEGWGGLSDSERHIWYFAIHSVLEEYGDVLRVLHVDLADHDMV